MKKELFQANGVEEYGIKSSYDLAGPSRCNDDNYESMYLSHPETKKKGFSPYDVEVNEGNERKINEKKPMCQITFNLNKEDFYSDHKINQVITMLREFQKIIHSN